MSNKERMEEKKEVTQKVENSQNDYVNEQNQKVSNEAVEVVNMVVSVIEQLKAKDKEKALNTIAEVLGKLEVLIAKDPSKELIPVDVKREVIDFPGTLADVLYTKEVIEDLVKNDELQKARDIMLQLASELDIYVTVLPVVTYPTALKAIVPLIEQEKFDEAMALIVKVIETLVIEKIVIPLPILRAEQTIIKASELTKDREDANREELKELIAYAKEQLELAQALGYGKVDEDYKGLLSEVEKIETILEGEDSTKDIFETLKEKLSSFMSGFNRVSEPTQMPKAEDKDKKEEDKESK
jgi:hypothetical protein